MDDLKYKGVGKWAKWQCMTIQELVYLILNDLGIPIKLSKRDFVDIIIPSIG